MTSNTTPGDHAARARAVEESVKTWTGELVDLGGRNTLLYYRDLKQGTLDLGPGSAAIEVAVDQLLSGRRTRLSDVFDDRAIAAAARRARTISAKARENFEERGLQTLFVAWGMATWLDTRGTATPAAPVLLRQAALAPRGGAGEDFDVVLPGEWEFNPTLAHFLKTDHQIDVLPHELVDLLDDDADPPDAFAVFERLTKASTAVSGFVVSPRVVIGNFSYAKLPMVLDMQAATDALVASDLICAIAGDDEAREAVRARHPNVTLDQPDFVPPQDEFLVLDADASQSYVLNAALGGADLVVDGPPGTGKSQTIANLIATLAARGHRILFVTEKRAAIDAVLERLDRVGLSDLVLDLHEGAGSKRKLAAEIARALATASSLPKPDMADLQETLLRGRQTLVDRTRALHVVRVPWGISVYDTQARLLGIGPDASSQQRLRGDILTRLDSESFRRVRSDLDALVGLGGLTLTWAVSPWAGAFAAGAVGSPDAARAALEAVSTLSNHTLPDATAQFDRSLAECGLTPPETVGAWVELLQLLEGVAATLEVFKRSWIPGRVGVNCGE